MRSPALFRRSRTLLKASIIAHPVASPSRHSLRLLRNSSKDSKNARRVFNVKRLLSSDILAETIDKVASSNPPEDPHGGARDGPEPPADDSDKPKLQRTPTSAKESEPLELPVGLDILWSPSSNGPTPTLEASALPPPEIFADALNNLNITLHPQTQHRATYPTPAGPPTEPTLALYCPIEGGEYIIDATVRELANRTGAEVLVLDAVQLAAGEWGQFGKAANALQLPRNPLHFPSAPSSSTTSSRRSFIVDEDDEPDIHPQMPSLSPMTLAVMGSSTFQGRAIMSAPSRRNSPPSRIKTFFDTVVNIPSKEATPSKNQPRLIYIRDFPTLAPTSSVWYPPLLSAVRQRRRGPLSRPSSPVGNPITIIFGMSPSVTPPVPRGSSSGPNNGMMNLLMSRSSPSPQATSLPRPSKPEWNEDDAADKAREKRLRDRLRKWEKGDAALYDEFSSLSIDQDGEGNSDLGPDVIVIGGSGGMSGFPPMISSGNVRNRTHDGEANSPFFRTSVLVPGVRSVNEEKNTRVARRREINEITMRMGLGAVGGVLEVGSAVAVHHGTEKNSENPPQESQHEQMWSAWGDRVEVWSNVRQIADRALGSIMAFQPSSSIKAEKATLEATVVPWSAVHKAWAAHQSARDIRKTWTKEASHLGKTVREHDDLDEDENEVDRENIDEVVEKIKNDSEIDSHEQRLLSCIVDAGSMPTSFSQVHLPPHTIDSVRTIVSLPLLHPQAFQHGILKEHGMTGCLLFGPPGTGKTLVVRALAKEAGCRMLSISPSDVMDMYVGEGEKLVKAVFSLARKMSPCVVFLDEIDALFGARMSARESGGAFAHRGVITEFMQEMDGLKSSKDDNVIVIGATNRPFDLDDAVLRRLPRRLLVDLPGEKEREEILKILLRDETLASDLDIKDLATKTDSFSGSDLKHLCVSAALDAIKEQVHVPWSSSAISSTVPVDQPTAVLSPAAEATSNTPRVLGRHNFAKALKEITPSSSEALGSLAELRKWNEEFGEGQRDRKRQQVWGKGRFGFTDKISKGGGGSVMDALRNASIDKNIS